MADQDRANQGTGLPGQGGQRPGDQPQQQQQQQQQGAGTPGAPRRTPRGAAGRTEAASRGGRRSAEVQVRDEFGQFAGRAGGSKKRERGREEEGGRAGEPGQAGEQQQQQPGGGAGGQQNP